MADDSPLLLALELVGIFVFALSGGLVAVRKHLDVFGVLVLALTTGLGGGSCATSSSTPPLRPRWRTGATSWCRWWPA